MTSVHIAKVIKFIQRNLVSLWKRLINLWFPNPKNIFFVTWYIEITSRNWHPRFISTEKSSLSIAKAHSHTKCARGAYVSRSHSRPNDRLSIFSTSTWMNGTLWAIRLQAGAARTIVMSAFVRVVPPGRVNIARATERILCFSVCILCVIRKRGESRSAKLASIRFVWHRAALRKVRDTFDTRYSLLPWKSSSKIKFVCIRRTNNGIYNRKI